MEHMSNTYTYLHVSYDVPLDKMQQVDAILQKHSNKVIEDNRLSMTAAGATFDEEDCHVTPNSVYPGLSFVVSEEAYKAPEGHTRLYFQSEQVCLDEFVDVITEVVHAAGQELFVTWATVTDRHGVNTDAGGCMLFRPGRPVLMPPSPTKEGILNFERMLDQINHT